MGGLYFIIDDIFCKVWRREVSETSIRLVHGCHLIHFILGEREVENVEVLAAVMMLSSVATFAQHEEGSLTIQPRVGVNIASLTKNDGGKARIGLAAGAELEYQVSDIFSLSAGAMYSMQGAKNGNIKLNLDYINVPVMANVYVVPGLAVKLGLQPGFKVNSKVDVLGVSANIPGAKSVDLSLPIGLSYEYKNFVLDGRYNFGLTKVNEIGDSKNSVFQITAGYKFDI